MAHLHELRDTDTHFVIDPITREITNPNTEKTKLMQGDHNSEIYTFEIPKIVEGHDMSLCNAVRIHYNDISADKADSSKDFYQVTDMQVDKEQPGTLVFSWLISGNATKYAGLLSFRIQFLCIDGDGNVTYKWHTDIFRGITVSDGFENTEAVAEEYADVLAEWEQQLIEAAGNSIYAVTYTEQTLTEDQKAQARANVGAASRHELEHSTRTLNLYDFTAGTPATNGTGFSYTDTRHASTIEFLECTKEYPYSITPKEGCTSTANVYYYSNGKYIGSQGGFKTYIADVTKGYKGNENVTHVRFGICYKNQTEGGLEKIIPANIADAVNEFTFTRSYIDPYARQSVLPKFDASGYNIPVLRLAGSIGCMTKEVDVPLTYVYGERSGNCTLKWQGNSSLQYEKKNYTIKFDTAFEAATGWGEQKKYCIKANFVDFTQARNVCSAKLWGQVVATREGVPAQLAAAPNYGAVDGFPIALYINDKYYGVYTFNIPKDKWMFNMGKGENEAVVCAEGPVDTDKVRFRKSGVILDTAQNVAEKKPIDYAIEHVLDEDNPDWIATSLDTMITKLNEYFITDKDGNTTIKPDMTEADMDALETYIDWDSVIDYIIFTCATNGYDGITKNHILLTYNGKKWYFSAYDMDCTFGIHGSQGKLIPMSNTLAQQTTIETMCTLNNAMRLVRRQKKAELVARYNELRSGVLSEDNVITTFTNFVADIPKALYDEECLIWKTLPATSISNVHQIADFYKRKCAILDAEIAAIKL